MNFIVPGAVERKLAEIKNAQKERLAREDRAREAEDVRQLGIWRLRTERAAELSRYVDDLTDWHNQLHNSGFVDRLRGVLGDDIRLPVFIAKFWRGEPSPSDDVTTWAVLSLRTRQGVSPFSLCLSYEEWHKGRLISEDLIPVPCDIVDTVHPDFLEQLHAHLIGPDAWRYILEELERRK